jgi:histone H3/H4
MTRAKGLRLGPPWAEQQRSPSQEKWAAQLAEEQPAPAAPRTAPAPLAETDERDLPRDVLVVISKLKTYIRARSGFNTSDTVTDVLSEHLRELSTQAIRAAAADGRKTVMDRDFRQVLQRHK